MKVFLVVVVVVAWFHAGEVKCEADFHVGLQDVRYGNPISLSPPSSRYHDGQYRDHHHSHHYDDRPVGGSYGSSEYAEYGGGWESQPPPPPSKHQFRSHHPNSLPSSEYSKPGFEVVRAPVIYHQTVTDKDSDVTKALANALGVVQTLRHSGSRYQGYGQQDSGSQGGYGQSEPDSGSQGGYGQPVRTLTNVEYVSHSPPQQEERHNRLRPTTVTTTIVDVPQRVEVLPQRTPSASPVSAQPARQQRPPVPAAADLPPSPPSSPATVIATSAEPTRVTNTVRPSEVPVRSSAVLVTPSSSAPRLIIPSQSHVTTLTRTAQATKVDQTLNSPQFQTVIQPVYIPYAVDQNGQPVGPLPDYHTMDFGALLNAQQQLLTVAPHAAPTVASAPTVQLLEAPPLQQPQQLLHVAQPQQQLIQVQQQQQQLLHVEPPQQQQQLLHVEPPQQQLVQVQQQQQQLIQPQQQLIQVQQPQQQLIQVQQPQLIQQPQQLVQVQQPPQQQLIEVQHPQQQFYVQQDHVVAASSSSSSETAPDGPSPTPTSTRYGRRRRIKKARKIAQRA